MGVRNACIDPLSDGQHSGGGVGEDGRSCRAGLCPHSEKDGDDHEDVVGEGTHCSGSGIVML